MLKALFASQSMGADASRVAAMAVAMWKNVGIALAPIIGRTGVDALFTRSIHMTRAAHPCLAIIAEDNTQGDILAALQAVLVQQPDTTAVAANIALLQNFEDLLGSLIGLSLTKRLLRPVWDKPSSGQTEQDATL
ncbi:hypothetical protein PY254_07830 [Rhodanobacter sp. AS-Z3]|uniref:hypothetical protein n=1 Tax=Rhodanobacter sp. AS-Z3 TaxID=3031330 RepID=UPI00247B28D6|nr:hypothetical protein [Rhodanobacter sp. AS-Z3]WEN16562.1 hypothetical protein PY254_07830 [Rhodanobacter sp. AS-Z3]